MYAYRLDYDLKGYEEGRNKPRITAWTVQAIANIIRQDERGERGGLKASVETWAKLFTKDSPTEPLLGVQLAADQVVTERSTGERDSGTQ